jgi:hypothetical protein
MLLIRSPGAAARQKQHLHTHSLKHSVARPFEVTRAPAPCRKRPYQDKLVFFQKQKKYMGKTLISRRSAAAVPRLRLRDQA